MLEEKKDVERKIEDIKTMLGGVDRRVIDLEHHYSMLLKQVDEIDTSSESLKKELRTNLEDMIRYKTVLENLSSDVSDLQKNFTSMSDKQDQILNILNDYKLEMTKQASAQWRYGFWFMSGVVVSAVLVSLGGHFFGFL